METKFSPEVEIQQRYYAETAQKYESMHVHTGDEHYFALCVMLGAVDFLGVKSILEIGSGTGRAIGYMKTMRPNVLIRGIEPVKELREIAYSKGISPSELTEGDALALKFEANQFDMVCEFGVLHHIKTPAQAVAEMLRVANKAIFISDSNNFGQGSWFARSMKQVIDMLGLWPMANLIKTRGRGYSISEGDGLAYSYSVFSNLAQIKQQCKSIHLFNTGIAGSNLYRTAGHVGLIGVK
jgi:ubiquinone/menaquinone biosynthesis C-methylase UbiE